MAKKQEHTFFMIRCKEKEERERLQLILENLQPLMREGKRKMKYIEIVEVALAELLHRKRKEIY